MTGGELRDQLQATLGTAYAIERELGGGGMSRVFVAEERALGRKVAVKVLSTELGADLDTARFRREIALAARLPHPHIVPVLTAGETGGLPFYTMPFVEGESLRGRLERQGRLPVHEALEIVRDVAKALAFAHAAGVVHRDIKPENVLIAGGSAMVTDFGIAKALSSAISTRSARATLTMAGISLGTPAYMAPEQAAADPAVDQRADIYALGALAYELLSGRPPFHGMSVQRLVAAHIADPPPPLRETSPDVPAPVADLVMRCLEKDPDARPADASVLLAELDRITRGGTGSLAALAGGKVTLVRALVAYAALVVAVAGAAWLALAVTDVPDWVLPVALVLMALVLPVVLVTALAERAARHITGERGPDARSGGRRSGPLGAIGRWARPLFSWRRTAGGVGIMLTAFVLVVIGYAGTRALGIGPWKSLLAAGTLGVEDALIVADFGTDEPRDSALGGVIAEAVRADLGQSAVVHLAPASLVRDALQRMRHPPTKRVDMPVALELARREGIKAIVDGQLTPLGAGHIVTVRLTAASSGDEIASFRETSAGPEQLIPTVEKLTRKLRGRIGESLREVRASPALERVTTASLPALEKFAEGSRALDYRNDFATATRLLQEAIALDSAFASAWRKLAAAYFNASMPRELVREAADRSYQYRDRLTERERLLAEGFYYDAGSGQDRARAADAYERSVRAGEVEGTSQLLANVYMSRRDFARAESVYRARIAAAGAPRAAHSQLMFALFHQGRREAAESIAVRLPRLFANTQLTPYEVYFLDNRGQLDSAQTILERRTSEGSDFYRAQARTLLAQLALKRGRLSAARQEWARAAEINVARGGRADPVADSVRASMADVLWLGERERAVRRLDAALERWPLASLPRETAVYNQPYYHVVATVYALAGRPDRARSVLDRFERETADTAYRRRMGPATLTVLGEIALAEGKADEAMRLFRRGDSLPDGAASLCAICVHANVARSHDAAGDRDSAIAAYERYFAEPQLNRLSGDTDTRYAALAARRLGELYEGSGDAERARAAYQRFIALWSAADAPLQPRVTEARERLRALRDPVRRGPSTVGSGGS